MIQNDSSSFSTFSDVVPTTTKGEGETPGMKKIVYEIFRSHSWGYANRQF